MVIFFFFVYFGADLNGIYENMGCVKWKICAVKMKAQNHLPAFAVKIINCLYVCTQCTPSSMFSVYCTAPIIHSCKNENTVGVYNDNKM